MDNIEPKNFPNSEKIGWPWNEMVDKKIYEGREWPQISVITPSFNQGQFIEETIRSILLQNYPNLEYIIIDGESSDNTIEIINNYKPWIDKVISEKDEGQSDALIKGFSIAAGQFMNWINSDDILCKNALYHIGMCIMSHPKVNFIHGINGIMNIDSVLYSQMPHPKDHLKERYISEMPYGQQACFFSSNLYKLVGGINKKLSFSMDYELYLRMHLIGAKTKQIDNAIGNIRIHSNTKTSNLDSVMYQENGNAFMTYLRSSNQNSRTIFLKKLEYGHFENYTIRTELSKNEKTKIYLRFLRKIIWYYYNNNQLKKAKRIAVEIIKQDVKEIFNLNYIKIIKDGTFRIL